MLFIHVCFPSLIAAKPYKNSSLVSAPIILQSTSAACNCLVNKITKHFKINKIAPTIFLDLSKAVDKLNYQILLNKLYHYGFCSLLHKLIAK